MKKLFFILVLLFTATITFATELKFLDIATENSTKSDVKKILKQKKIKFETTGNSYFLDLDNYEGIKTVRVILKFNSKNKFCGFEIYFTAEDNGSEIIDEVGNKLIEEYDISAEKNSPFMTGRTIYQIYAYSTDGKYFLTFGGDITGEEFITLEKKL